MWRNRFLWMLAACGAILVGTVVADAGLDFDVVWPQGVAGWLGIASLAGLAFTARTSGGRITARICLGSIAAVGIAALVLSPVSIGLAGGVTDENRFGVVGGLVATGLVLVVLPFVAIVVSIKTTRSRP